MPEVIPGLVPDVVLLLFQYSSPRALSVCGRESSVSSDRRVEALPSDRPELTQNPSYLQIPERSLELCRSFEFRVLGRCGSLLRFFLDRPDPADCAFALKLHSRDRCRVLVALQISMPGAAIF